MKSLLIALFIACQTTFAVNKATTPYRISSGQPARASEVLANFDSLRIPFNNAVDTMNKIFPRFTPSSGTHDSTLKYINIDTIRSNPNIDSISGNTVLSGSPKITGTVSVDSLCSTKGIKATTITASSTSNLDSVKTAKGINVTGPALVSGSISSDSSHSRTYTASAQNGYRNIISTGEWPSQYGLTIQNTADQNYVAKIAINNTAMNSFEIKTGTGGNDTSRIFIKNGGNVGIGTTTPAANLDVNGHALTSTFKTGACTTGAIRSTTGNFSSYLSADSINADHIGKEGTFSDTLFDSTTYVTHATGYYTIKGKTATVYLGDLVSGATELTKRARIRLPAILRPTSLYQTMLISVGINGASYIGSFTISPAGGFLEIVYYNAFGTVTWLKGVDVRIVYTTITYSLQ